MTSKQGRPKKNTGPAFPHDEVDKLLALLEGTAA